MYSETDENKNLVEMIDSFGSLSKALSFHIYFEIPLLVSAKTGVIVIVLELVNKADTNGQQLASTCFFGELLQHLAVSKS